MRRFRLTACLGAMVEAGLVILLAVKLRGRVMRFRCRFVKFGRLYVLCLGHNRFLWELLNLGAPIIIVMPSTIVDSLENYS